MNANDNGSTRESVTSGSIVISHFLQSLKNQKVSVGTLRAYATDLRGFFDHHHLKTDSLDISALEKLQLQDIESYLRSLAGKKMKFATIKRNVATIRRFFAYLSEQGILTGNPTKTLNVRRSVNDALTFDQIVSLLEYFQRRQHAGNESDTIRYRRDELILLLMIFYGVRQYQLGALRLSSLQKDGNIVTLTVKKGFIIKLDGVLLDKLRAYLSIRNSNSDSIFLDLHRKKSVDHSTMRAILIDASNPLHIECSPRLLHDTFVHLQQNPRERQRLLNRIAPEFSSHNDGVTANV